MTGPPPRPRPLSRQQRQHPPGHRRHTLLDHLPLRRGDPAGQARRGRGRQPRHRRDLLASRIGALPVQPRQEVLPGQLRRREPGQQLPGPEPPVPLPDRPIAASSASITPSRPHNSVTAARPASPSAPHPARRPGPAAAAACCHVSCSPDRCPLRRDDHLLGSDHHPRPERHLSAPTRSCHPRTRGIGSEDQADDELDQQPVPGTPALATRQMFRCRSGRTARARGARFVGPRSDGVPFSLIRGCDCDAWRARAGRASPTQSPVEGAPAAPQGGAALSSLLRLNSATRQLALVRSDKRLRRRLVVCLTACRIAVRMGGLVHTWSAARNYSW